MRVFAWILIVLAWGAVQLPMAWCDQSGLHPEIPVGHDHDEHDHDHDKTEVHHRVDLDIVLPGGGIEEVEPLVAAVGSAPGDAVLVSVRIESARCPESPPGRARLTTVLLL